MLKEDNLTELIKEMNPVLNKHEYVFCCVDSLKNISRKHILCEFKEEEGTTIVIKREKADQYGLPYSYIASWITLKVFSSLNAVGLTAIISTALAEKRISCNIIAGYHHDHIFVDKEYGQKAIDTLIELSKNYNTN
ncbi:ACT domain-containing protein [Flavobacteriaceae bacterium R38]|nr:ACT domain-containing protein [Flavobacteriaceae bacterium R38]